MADFKKGDTVRLKSGGPPMTVLNVVDYGPAGPTECVACVWFDGKRKEHDIFDSAVLKLSEGGSGVVNLSRV